jgi:hypothetical protein
MKLKTIAALVALTSNLIFCQEIGIDFNVGYTKLKMNQVNKYLDNSEFVDAGSQLYNPSKYNKIGMSLCFELGVSARFSQFKFGLLGTYFSPSGLWESLDTIRSINQNIDVSSIEIVAIAGYSIPIYKTSSALLEGGIGYGFASSEIENITKSYPSFNEVENIKYDLNGGYFIARLRGGFEAKLKWLVLRLVLGYRYANPVVLKGDSTVNGEKMENQPVIDRNGNELKFDFSGIQFVWGISVLL